MLLSLDLFDQIFCCTLVPFDGMAMQNSVKAIAYFFLQSLVFLRERLGTTHAMKQLPTV